MCLSTSRLLAGLGSLSAATRPTERCPMTRLRARRHPCQGCPAMKNPASNECAAWLTPTRTPSPPDTRKTSGHIAGSPRQTDLRNLPSPQRPDGPSKPTRQQDATMGAPVVDHSDDGPHARLDLVVVQRTATHRDLWRRLATTNEAPGMAAQCGNANVPLLIRRRSGRPTSHHACTNPCMQAFMHASINPRPHA